MTRSHTMTKCRLIAVLFLIIYPILGFTAENASFDEICAIYTEAKNSSLTSAARSEYIFKNVENRIQSKDALQAHSAVFNLEPKKRYAIFKKSAEYSLKKKWDCETIKQLMK